MYEVNTSLVVVNNPLLSYPLPLPVGGSESGGLLAAPVGPGPVPGGVQQPFTTFLVDSIFQLDVTAPPGQDDVSTFVVDIGGADPGTSTPLWHCTDDQQISVAGGQTGTFFLHVCGIVKVLNSDSLNVTITRAVGNTNVTVSIAASVDKYKILN